MRRLNPTTIALIATPVLALANEPLKNADHWSFQPLQEVQVPNGGHPIDGFVRQRLAQEGLKPNPQADRRTLIRRLYFDLHGLPPTPEAISEFLADSADDDAAVAKLIQQLLDDPAYGERWARHWLDVVRYSESQGFERDKFRPNSWRYRDYVIQSLNADKPYDQFAREQVAGDVLAPKTREGIIATGFLVAGPWDEVGNGQRSQVMKRRVREEELEDMIAAVGQTFLGVTINCARCHDHKFDPIPAKDYYAFKATFEGVRHGERTILTSAEVSSREADAAQLRQNSEQIGLRLQQLRKQAVERHIAGNKKPTSAAPFARWTFDHGNAEDEISGVKGELKGGATVRDGRLILNGKDAYVQTEPLPKTLDAKTLEAWLTLSNLDQRAGGALSIERLEPHGFDGLVFAERQSKKWIAGSDFFKRTQDLNAPAENAKPGELIHVAATYQLDGTITFYRNGQIYGEPYKPEERCLTYEAGKSHVLIGVRLTNAARGFLNAEIDEARIYDWALTKEEISESYAAGRNVVGMKDLLAELTAEERAESEKLKTEHDQLNAKIAKAEERPLVYAARAQKPQPTHFLERGDIKLKGDLVAAAGLTAMSGNLKLTTESSDADRRRAFATWLTSKENALFARTIVNRVWHYHFGAGLVKTPNDLGVSGGEPSHPQLLDWLAAEFIRGGYSLKKLHALILTSQTWRQSSVSNSQAFAKDADNRLLWRFAPRRLEAEAIRDSMLAVSGELNSTMGGPSDKPYDLVINNTHFYTFKDTGEPQLNRRTVYRAQIASLRDTLMDSLDCPSIGLKAPTRDMTATPVQALAMMNNSFVNRQSQKLAERLDQEATGKIEKAFLLVLGRDPTPKELAQAQQLESEHSSEEICWALFNSTEFIFVQ